MYIQHFSNYDAEQNYAIVLQQYKEVIGDTVPVWL